jgi:hypothetical protein
MEENYLYLSWPRHQGEIQLQRMAKEVLNALHGADPTKEEIIRNHGRISCRVPDIKNVIFNPPATIIMWADGTKTVVKAVNEDYDPEKGLAMAITKKALGNKGNYFNDIKKWTDKYDVKSDYPKINSVNKLSDGLKKCADKLVRDLDKTIIKVLRRNNADAHDTLSAILSNTHATKKDLIEAIESARKDLRRTTYD